MTATVFLVLVIVASIGAIAAVMSHVARAGEATAGPATTADPDDTSPPARRGTTPLAGRLADDAAHARATRSPAVPAADQHAEEAARATPTAKLARREQRLRALTRRRPLTTDEAAALLAARTVLAERGRAVPPVEAVPRLADEGAER